MQVKNITVNNTNTFLGYMSEVPFISTKILTRYILT